MRGEGEGGVIGSGRRGGDSGGGLDLKKCARVV